jgi:hypothetical protein
MADPDSRGKPQPPKLSAKFIRPGEEVVKPAPKPKVVRFGEGMSSKTVRPGDQNTTGATVALPYETIVAAARREAAKANFDAEMQRTRAMRDSVIGTDERHKLRATAKRIKKIGIMI